MSAARNIIKNPKLVSGGGGAELTVPVTFKQKSSSIEGIEKVNCSFKTHFEDRCFLANILIIILVGIHNSFLIAL